MARSRSGPSTRGALPGRGERGRHGAGPERGPASGGGLLLPWALDREGRRVRASALGAAERRGRAPFRCPGCAETVVPHLGRVRAPHFAHAPGSRCPLASPETALHLWAKERLLALAAEAFAGRRAVALRVRCPGCRRPERRDLAALGDAAAAEAAAGALRVDLLVSRAGRPALAVEIRVTHEVDPGKASALAAAGLPAIEVDARTEWEREEAAGTIVECARSFGFAPCPACAALSRAEAGRAAGGEAAQIAELEAYRARGLLGLPPAAPSRPSTRPGAIPAQDRPPGRPGAAGGELRPASDAPLSAGERSDLSRRFRCPDCGSNPHASDPPDPRDRPGSDGLDLGADAVRSGRAPGSALVFGERLARHVCREGPARPVAWRGYDGSLVEMAWWRR